MNNGQCRLKVSPNQPILWRLTAPPKEELTIYSMRDNNHSTNRNIDQPTGPMKAHHPKGETFHQFCEEYFGVTLFCWTVQEDSLNISMKWVGQEFSSPSKTILGKKFNLHCVFVCFYGRGTKQARYWKYWWIEVASLWTSLCERLMRCYRWQKHRWHAWGHLGRLDPYGTSCNQCSAIKYNPCPLISFKY